MADPKNKWSQPAAPPAPMFFGKKERDLVKQVNDELAERIIGQPIAYYPISIEESNFNETYGEAIEKVSLPPVRVYAFVEVSNEQTHERYGYEYQSKLTINFNRKRLTEDQNLYVRVGDFVQYGDQFYEIVRTYNDTRYYFGQVEHKFQVSAECITARAGSFRVMPAISRSVDTTVLADGSAAPAPRAAPYPPLEATYITVTSNTKLPNERVLTAGTGITITDAGAGKAITVASTAQSAAGAVQSIQLNSAGGVFGASTNLTYVTGSNLLQVTGTVSATKVTASYINLGGTSGSLAGSGSYLGLDANNNIVLTASSGSPGGSTTQLQYNDGGSFQGSSNLTFDGSILTGSFTGSIAHLSTLSASLMNLAPTSGTLAGAGSYLGLDFNNNVILSAGDGATTSPAGSTTEVQFNNAGSFGASSNLTFNSTSNLLALTGTMAVSSSGDQALFRVDGATNGNVLFVTGSGKVGIGTTTPGDLYTLDMPVSTSLARLGRVELGSWPVSTGYGYLGHTNQDHTGYNYNLLLGSNGSLDLNSQTTPLGFRTDAVLKAAITIDGNFGIGLNAGHVSGFVPSALLQVSSSGDQELFRVDGATAGNVLFVTGSGRVGIGTSTPSHLLTVAGASHLSGGVVHKRTAITNDYNVALTDYYLGVDTTSNTVDLTLPAASTATEGQTYVVKDEGGNAATNVITILRSASDTIDGTTSVEIESAYAAVSLYTDGANWFIY